MNPHLTIHYNTDDYYQPDEKDLQDKYIISVDDQDGKTWVFTDGGYFKIPLDRAEYLVKAVNTHAALLEALEKAQAVIGDLVRYGNASDDETDAYSAIKLAIAKAEGKGSQS